MSAYTSVLREMADLQRNIDQAFGMPTGRGWRRPFPGSFHRPARGARTWPLLNMSEDDEGFHIEGLAPGMTADSLKVTVMGDQLTISGERKDTAVDGDKKETRHNERVRGRFERVITLPGEVDTDKVTAQYKDGLIRIDAPKSERARPKMISVNIH